MYITFRDELGMSLVEVDEYGIGFVDGVAYFSSVEREYRVRVENLCEIVRKEERK